MRIISLALLLTLTACGCALDKGDSRDIGSYWDGCWSAAQRDTHPSQ